MSQLTPANVSATRELRTHWMLGLSALFALAATVAVVLVLAIDGATSHTRAAPDQPQAAQRSDAGPDASAVDASVASDPSSARPIGESLPASHGPAAPKAEPGPARPIGGSIP